MACLWILKSYCNAVLEIWKAMSILVIIMIQISEWIWQLVVQLFEHYATILKQKNVNELGLYLI